MDAQHQQPTEAPGTGRPERDAQSLLIITHLAAQPTREAFFVAWHRLLDLYVAIGMEVGWSREVAEEVADEEMARASTLLGSLNPHFVNEAGHG
ncbi:hypothetical protein [Azospirillum sp. B2RO_4]|uniref:hypothetical protein n=1 Tax=Azospirillum sp. B2RO_4 TaxID=3027796 RepID=UPI003DAA0307